MTLWSFLFTLWLSTGWAQQAQLVSHYPATALTVDRLIPFSIVSNAKIEIEKVEFTTGEFCQSILDPFYSEVFHIRCSAAENWRARVTYRESGVERVLTTVPIAVRANPLPPEPDL